jgi:hypothetical protein
MNWIEHICEPQRLILAWQPADTNGERFRWAVGELGARQTGAIGLRYFEGEEFSRLNNNRAFADIGSLGYRGYPGFNPKRPVYPSGVLEAFLRRIPPPRRSDFAEYLHHFRLKPGSKLSEFALLGYTEAKLPSDGFSLVNPLDCVGERFEVMLEIVGFRHQNAPLPSVGDVASLEPEPTNEKDPNAVRVCVAGKRVGYVNRLQALAFLTFLSERRVVAVIERVNGNSSRPRVFAFIRVTSKGDTATLVAADDLLGNEGTAPS